MSRQHIFIIFIVVACVVVVGLPAHAASIKMQPLLYKEHIEKGEKKKGFIDISNPTGTVLKLTTSVQAFRQIDSKGAIEFYDDPQLRAGITPDYKEFTLAPRQAMRMVFLIDGTKLPQGNVFGALFVTASDAAPFGIGQAVRIGTILSLTNDTSSSQQFSIEKVDISPLQLGDALEGKVTVKNNGEPKKTTGFYPAMSLRLGPIFSSSTRFDGPLIFPGITRDKSFVIEGSRIGFYKLSIYSRQTNKELGSRWVFVVTGWWRVIGFVGCVTLFGYFISRYFANRSLVK